MTRKHASMCCSGKPKSSKDDHKRLPMTCGIRLTPSENSIAIISDDGDFVYQAALSPVDSYTVLLPQLAAAITDACSEQDASTPIGVAYKGMKPQPMAQSRACIILCWRVNR